MGNKTKKRYLSDKQITSICAKGQFNTYAKEGSLYNQENKDKLATLPKYTRDYNTYTAFLKNIFSAVHKVPKKYDPQDDFYTYVNYEWLKKEATYLRENLKYYVEVDDFRIVQDKVYKEVIDYTLKYIKEHPTEKKALEIKNVYESFKKSKITTGVKECKDRVDTIDHHIDSGDVYSLLAYINQDEVVSWQCPISWSVSPDEKDVSKYITHITPPQLGLYDYMIYIDDPASSASEKRYKKEYKTKYLDFIKKTFDACLGGAKHNKFNPQDVWDVEYELLMAMGCGEVKNENANYYNPLTLSEVENDYHFDLTEFTKKLGYKTPPKRVIISSLSAFKCIVKLVEKNWNTDKWRTYWIFMWFKQMIRFQEEWRDIYFDFYGKYVEGQTVKMPIDTYSIFGLSFSFNTFLTEQYVNHKRNPTYVNYVKQLVEDLKQVFIRRVNRNTWLSPSTKKAALRKLEKLYVVVGSPDKMRNDPVLDYTNDNPWHNMLTLAKWKHKKFIELEGKEVIDIPQIDWNKFKLVGTQAYMVNAYYRPTSNSIYVPLAYLQKPFIDLDERGIEYNMAYIGYTLGHELSHSLDDNGSKFDENGNLNNWWTDEDRKKFKRKIDDVIKQYEEFAKRDGIEFDAEIGVGEDIADIAGLSLAEEYLLDFQKVNDDIDIIKKISLEAFYVYSAVQSRQKISKQALPAQLKTNPHPLEKYRCNCPLSRLQLFRSIYNVKKDDDMWWHNTDTVW